MYDTERDSRITTRRFVKELLQELRQLSYADQFRTLTFYFTLKFKSEKNRFLRQHPLMKHVNAINLVNLVLAAGVIVALIRLFSK